MKKSIIRKIMLSVLSSAVLFSASSVLAAEVNLIAGNGDKGFTGSFEELKSDNESWYFLNGQTDIVSSTNSKSNNTLVFDGVDFYERGVEIWGGESVHNTNYETAVYETAVENIVEVRNCNFDNGVSSVIIVGGFTWEGNVKNNIVTIKDSVFENVESIYAGYSLYGDSINNVVNIKDCVLNASEGTQNISGGRTQSGGNANTNVVVVSNTTFSSQASIDGGYADSGDSLGNVVTIHGNTKFMEDGYVTAGSVWADDAKAYNNTVNLISISTDGLKDVNVFGGFKTHGDPLYGGASTPNTLNIKDVGNGTKISQIGGFDIINFDGVKWEVGKSVIEVEKLYPHDTDINVKNIFSSQLPQAGEKMDLIKIVEDDSQSSSNTPGMMRMALANNVNTGGVAGGSTRLIGTDSNINVNNYLQAEGDLTESDENISLTINQYTGASENTAVLGESRIAATAFVNQGSELIETGLDALARDNQESDTKVFAAVYGNRSEYETGSHVKVNGWSGIVGIGKTTDDGLTMGAFFENGEGNYRTYKNIDNGLLHGDGEATYNGGGFLIRKDNTNGAYIEASLRAGNLQNELLHAVRDGRNMDGYDIDTFYYGAHVGVGKIIPRGNDGDSVDVYGKFIYAHYDDENLNVNGIDTHFGSVESERLRLGFRVNEVQSNKLNMYYGAAWEYEFGGDGETTVLGFDAETPSLEGSTLIGEVGMHYNANEKWSIDLNVRGYGGERKGLSGSLQANYNF